MSDTTDGRKGHEWRTRWGIFCVYSWRDGWVSYRFPNRWVGVNWTLFARREVLIGVHSTVNRGEWDVELGCWPLHIEIDTRVWPRPTGDEL